MLALNERIREAIKGSGKKPAQIAVEIGRTPSAVSLLLNGDTRSLKAATALALEKATGYSSEWLVSGQGERIASHCVNVSFASQGRLVPIISFIQAGGWAEIQNDVWTEMFSARSSNPGPHAFALRVEGDSMTSDSTPTFPEGTIIIIDPDRGPKAGDYVVARYGESATFKRLMTDGAAWYLKPLNRDYRPIEIDKPEMVVVGVVIEYWTGGKL